METQNPVNQLHNSEKKSLKFAATKWYVIPNKNSKNYDEGHNNGTSMKFETKNIKSSLCDYLDSQILVTGDITSTGGNADSDVAYTNCASFTKCITHTNDEHIDTAENIDITMAMYNLIEYNDNYSYTSGSLWQFKRDESPVTNDHNPDNVNTNNSLSFE